jgi:hypothetical protein
MVSPIFWNHSWGQGPYLYQLHSFQHVSTLRKLTLSQSSHVLPLDPTTNQRCQNRGFSHNVKSETGGVLTPLPPRSPRSPSLKKGDQHSHWLRLRSSHSPRVGDFPKVFQLGDTWSCPCLHGCDHVTKTYSRSVPYHLISWLKTKTMNSIIAILKVIQNHIKSYHVFANLNSDFGISGFKCPLFFGEFWCHGLHELRKGTGARRRERNGSQDWSHFWDLNVGYHGISWDIPSGKLT